LIDTVVFAAPTGTDPADTTVWRPIGVTDVALPLPAPEPDLGWEIPLAPESVLTLIVELDPLVAGRFLARLTGRERRSIVRYVRRRTRVTRVVKLARRARRRQLRQVKQTARRRTP
jgi:hypothetical protein